MADGANERQLSAKQEMFVAAFIGAAHGNATEAARMAGYEKPNKQGPRLLVNVGVQERIQAYLAKIELEGIANQQNRVDAYNARWKLLEQVRQERASSDWLADIPGGSTGFVVKQLKSVKHVYERNPEDQNSKYSQVTVESWESAVDVGLLKEFRELEKQAAQDIGQWTEKRELTGEDGEPLKLIIERVAS